MDLALLAHDDAIDTISMSKHVIKTKGKKFRRERGQCSLTERIIREQPLVKGMPVLSGVSSAELSETDLNILSQKARGKGKVKFSKRRVRPRSSPTRRPRL